jgi:hypothetical protein
MITNTEEILLDATNQITRLNAELAEMRKINKQQMAFFQDAAAFIRGEWGNDVVLSTLIHDINGLAEDQPCFQPRVSGYAKRERETS